MLIMDKRNSDFWLKWLVELYGKDVSKLERSDIDRLASEVARFCRNYSGQSEFQTPVAVVRKHLKKLHDQLDDMFKSLIPVPSKLWSNPRGMIGVVLWPLPSAQMSIDLHRIHRLNVPKPDEPKRNTRNLSWAELEMLKGQAKWEKEAMSFKDGAISRAYTAQWPYIFWLAISDILVESGHSLWRCINCERLFIKRKRQAYCSPQCSQKVRSDRWYKRYKLKAQENRREGYKRKKRKETGFSNLRVGRSDQNPKR